MSAKVYRDHDAELKRIKKNVERSYQYFRDNYDSYNRFRNFIFVDTINEQEKAVNRALNRPNLEFNILESGVSRLRGEFAKNLPSIYVSGSAGQEVDGALIDYIEGRIRYIVDRADKEGFQYNVYTDTLSGGMSAAKVYTDYAAPMSPHQDIYVTRTFDPTMSFWDPLAKRPSKTDGRWCGEVFVMYRDEFEAQYSASYTKEMKFSQSVGMYKWSYSIGTEDMVVLCHYYESKPKKAKAVLLADGRVMTVQDYEKSVQEWNDSGKIEVHPAIVGEPWKTEIPRIYRYTICETGIIECELTDFDTLPIVFFDGNSVLTKDNENTGVKQVTRPIFFHAQGAQRLKNYAGQSLANELENMVQHKWIAPIEGIPENYAEAYKNIQEADVLIYNSFMDGNPEYKLAPPQAVVRPPIPQEIMGTFALMDETIQNIMGSFDPSIAKLGEREVSGIAIQESLSLSNSASMPYVVNYLHGFQALAQVILELIPKIDVTPRTMPILTAEGKKEYVKINQEGGVSVKYSASELKVDVVAGPSFAAQQDKALKYITLMSQASEPFKMFMAEEGMDVLLNNMEFKGVDSLKEKADAWVEQFKQRQAQARNQPNPEIIKIKLKEMELEQKKQEQMIDAQLKLAELEVQKQKLQLEAAKLQVSVGETAVQAQLDREKYHSDDLRKAAEMIMKSQKHLSDMSQAEKEIREQLQEGED